MVGIGIVGIGFMGMIHYLAARGLSECRVAALCSRDPRKLSGDWTGIQGNFGPRGTVMDLSEQARYVDFDELLADPQVDLVDLCVPTDVHARLALRALEAGKHVLVEKPIALVVEEADAMVAAAEASGRLLMVAHVVPFFPEFAFAAEAVRSGAYGTLRAVHLTRVISHPGQSGVRAEHDRSGGPAIDLHIHDTHFISLVCGIPRGVQSRGVVEDGAVVHLSTHYLFDDPHMTVSAVSGALSQSGRPFLHGFQLYLEQATLAFEFVNLAGQGHLAMPLSLILPDGSVLRPDLPSGDPIEAFTGELGAAVASVAAGAAVPPLSGALACQALRVCYAEIESVKTGQIIAIRS